MLPHAYIPLSSCGRIALAASAALVAFVDPSRGDAVALLGDLTSARALARRRDELRLSPDGVRLLSARPRLRGPAFTPEALAASHPHGSLGRGLGAYLGAHGFAADARAHVWLVEDEELAYVLARYREVHDVWHVLAGLPPTVEGETALKWLEMVHTGLPVAALSALVAPLRLPRASARALFATHAPWAVRCGRSCVPLLAVPYEELLSLPLDEVRARLRFERAPLIV